MHEGSPGIWFREDVAERVLRELKQARLSDDLRALYEHKIELLDDEIAAAQRLLELAEEAEQRALDASAVALDAQIEAEEQLTRWHRSPVLWFAAGIIVTGLATVAVSVAVAQ